MPLCGNKDSPMRRPGPISVAALLLAALSGCAKIDDFGKPHMFESFLGRLDVTPSVRGIHPGGSGTAGVTLSGDESGKKIVISGLPTNDPFPILHSDILKKIKIEDIPPTVAGLVAEVTGPQTLKVNGFLKTNDSASDLKVTVTGDVVRQGPQLSVTVLISAQVEPLRDFIGSTAQGEIALQEIQRIADKKPLADLPGKEVVPLYRIDFKGEIVTVL